MKKLVLFCLLFFLLTNCKKENLIPELAFLEGEWKLEKKYLSVNTTILSTREKKLVMTFSSNGELIYSDDEDKFEFRIVAQELETSEKSYVDFSGYKFYKRLKLKLKDKKLKTYYIYFYFQKNDNSRIFATYYKLGLPIMGTNINLVEVISIDPFGTANTSLNPYCGTFIKK